MSVDVGHIAAPRQSSRSILRMLHSSVQIAMVAVTLAMLLKTFVVDAIYVPSQSMQSTLMIGDFVFVNKMVYGARSARLPFLNANISFLHLPKFKSVSRGDVVVFELPSADNIDGSQQPIYFVKRVIALGGDVVSIRNGVVYVNDVRTSLPEHGSAFPMNSEGLGPVTVPQNHLFVLGDNRNHSYDSRYWGFLPEDNIIGQAMIVYWSMDQSSGVCWDRIGTFVR